MRNLGLIFSCGKGKKQPPNHKKMKEFTKCPSCGGPVEKEIKKEGTCYTCKDEECGWGICS